MRVHGDAPARARKADRSKGTDGKSQVSIIGANIGHDADKREEELALHRSLPPVETLALGAEIRVVVRVSGENVAQAGCLSRGQRGQKEQDQTTPEGLAHEPSLRKLVTHRDAESCWMRTQAGRIRELRTLKFSRSQNRQTIPVDAR